MIRAWARYVQRAYRPAIQVPFMLSWALGLTALFACASGGAPRWPAAGELACTAVTLVLDMLALRALDDIRDQDYDRAHNPDRALPSGIVKERDLVTLIAADAGVLLLLNAWRGVALLALVAQLGYAAGLIIVDRLAGWPRGDRLFLHLAVNLPAQALLSSYVYVSFLRAEHARPDRDGIAAVLAVTLAAMCLEFGRKVTRRVKPGERTYASVLGPTGTSAAALGCAAIATAILLAILKPWHSGPAGYGWLVLLPLVLPVIAARRFAAGAMRWPVLPTLGYIPAMYTAFLMVALLAKGTA